MTEQICTWFRAATFAGAALTMPLAAVAAVPTPASLPERQAQMPIDEIVAGQRGYGLSVFVGRVPERFEVEVLGVMREMAPGTSAVLARLTGHNLEKTGVIAGMSGSPVYIDGRLVGAVAAAWPFSHEAVGLITPISAMRALNIPLGQGALGNPVTAGGRAAAVGLANGFEERASAASTQVLLDRLMAPTDTGAAAAVVLDQELKRLAPRPAHGGLPGYQWSSSGFGTASQGLLERSLGAVGPAGAAAAMSEAEIVNGGAVAAVLVDGDLRLAATGTVTERHGEEILAFGHPFLAMGAVVVPMAPAEVVTVLSNSYSSFKIANFGKPVGAFVQDRAPGLLGRVGAEAPMVPLSIAVAGSTYSMRLAAVPELMPTLLAITALGALDRAASAGGAQGLDLDVRFAITGHGELRLRQSFDGDQAGLQSALYLLSAASLLSDSSFEAVKVDSIEVTLARAERPRTAALVAAHAERTLVEPGDLIGLSFDLLPYRGVLQRHGLVLELPADLPAGRYSLLIGDGTSLDAARFAIQPSEPQSFDEVLAILRSLHSRRDLGVLGVSSSKGLAVAGRVMPRLPGSLRAVWGAAASESAAPLRQAVTQQELARLELPVTGSLRIDLDVRRRPAVAAREGR
jgi:hypothetical protein